MNASALAEETKVSLRTIRRAEQNEGQLEINAANAECLKSVLEDKGIAFISDAEGGQGVVLRPQGSRRKKPA